MNRNNNSNSKRSSFPSSISPEPQSKIILHEYSKDSEINIEKQKELIEKQIYFNQMTDRLEILKQKYMQLQIEKASAIKNNLVILQNIQDKIDSFSSDDYNILFQEKNNFLIEHSSIKEKYSKLDCDLLKEIFIIRNKINLF